MDFRVQKAIWLKRIELYGYFESHIHLLVADDKTRNVIPDSIKLVAGRTGQEFN